ncbi:MAG TPA: PDZ domain-containing protein [Sporichthya sp.]|nr:PDZ domain-containing protein [Sporichthya sp.]
MTRNGIARRVAYLLAAAMTAAVAAGCGENDAAVSAPPGDSPTPGPAVTAGPFDPAELIGAGYQVTSSAAMPLGPAGEPDYRVVVSADRDAVPGGTQNVQVFGYRAGSWAEVFDAADATVPYAFQGDYGAPVADKAPDPVLNQKHRIEHVTVQPVQFGLESASLVINGEDKDNPEILGLIAVVDFVTTPGRANLDHFEMAQDLGTPTVTGADDRRQLQVPNFWYPWLNGGEPTPYTQTIGLTPDAGVAVVADSRPWLGAWVSPGRNPGVMVSQVVAGSPAERNLRVGDRIVSVNGNRPEQGLGPELLALKPGDEVTVTVDRGGTGQDVKLTLSDMSKAPTMWEMPTPATIGIEVAPLSGRPGIAVTDVKPGGPADDAGIRPGDAITRVGDVPTGDPADLDAALSGRAGQELEVGVQRGTGSSETMRVRPEKAPQGDVQVALL